MRMLFLNHNVAWSGTFYRAFHLGCALHARGHEVTVVTTSPTRRWGCDVAVERGVRLVFAPDLLAGRARTGWDPWNSLWRALHVRSGFDLVHAFDSRPAVVMPALTASRASGSPLVMDWADWWGRGGTITERSGRVFQTMLGPIETWFEEAFRTRAHGTTVISTALARRAAELGVDPQSTVLLPQGCDPDRFNPMHAAEAKARLGVAGPLLVHLGTIMPADLKLLMAALRQIRREMPQVRLVMVGDPRSMPPADLVATGAVRLTGKVPVEQLRLWLAAADLCVAPMNDTLANRGRWPSKINDYFVMARPTLITDVGDAARLVRERRVGYVAGANAESLASTAVAALQDADEREHTGRAARQLAEGDLAWSAVAERTESFYTRTMSATGTRASAG